MGVDYGKLEACLPVQKEEDYYIVLAKKLGVSREMAKVWYFAERYNAGPLTLQRS